MAIVQVESDLNSIDVYKLTFDHIIYSKKSVTTNVEEKLK